MIMPNFGGSKFQQQINACKRDSFNNIILSLCLLSRPKMEKILKPVRRTATPRRICCGFSTMTADTALILAGALPIDLEIVKRCPLHWNWNGMDRNVNEASLNDWQKRWIEETQNLD